MDQIGLNQWLAPLTLVAGGLLLGVVFEKFILGKMRFLARTTEWQSSAIIVNSLRGLATFWFFLAGFYGAVLSVTPAPPEVIRKALLVAVILSVTIFAARTAAGFVNMYAQRAQGLLPSTTIFTNLTRLLVFVIGGLVILQTLGISVMPILTALGVGGLAVALALQDTLSNLFAGLQIVASKQIRVGDYIKLDTGEEGHVVDISWRNTSIKALPNTLIVVPNSQLAKSRITNFDLPEKEMTVRVQVGVSYGSDLHKVERVTIDVAREVMQQVEGGVPEFEPFIRYHTFAESSINFSVILRVREFTDQYPVTHEFVKRLQQRYAKEGIVIPFPIRTVHLKNEKA